MKTGIELIEKERQRQIEKEGWTPEHDTQYKNGELFIAALCYMESDKEDWPWDIAWWKPSLNDKVKDLVKAGALFQAHYDLTGATHALKWRDVCADKIDQLLVNA